MGRSVVLAAGGLRTATAGIMHPLRMQGEVWKGPLQSSGSSVTVVPSRSICSGEGTPVPASAVAPEP